METFTLVVWLWLADDEPWGWGYREARTPGLGLDECMAAAKLVKPPQGRARCYLEGRPEPDRQTDNDYTLTVHEYVGGGRHQTTRFRNLNKSVCRTWAAEVKQAGGSAYCDLARSPCPDCPTIRDMIRIEGRAPS
jgi:hypothetical protein